MDRQDFIFTLFDNGDGLTLNQIADIEKYLPETFPSGLIEDIAKDMGENSDYPGVIESALYQARDVFLEQLNGCSDMLELKDLLEEIINSVTDMQVYRIWLVTREV